MNAIEPDLTPEVLARARLARDARFDGRFFVGVKTTGVYCRPVCPVPPPKEQNVRYFPSAAAAAEAGFRPCLRCRPECSPGTPAWNGSSATVSRALRLISIGLLDEGSVPELAAKLGIGPRQLGRLFRTHLGASPIAVAQTRRLHFAKRLIDDTALTATEIAHAAGYRSVRRFNDAFRKAYGRSPSALKRRAGLGVGVGVGAARSRAGERMHLRLDLPYRPPFDWAALLGFLEARAIPGVESVIDGAYSRTISVQGEAGIFTVRPTPGRNALNLSLCFADPRALIGIVERVRRLFDLAADPAVIGAALAADPDLAPLVRRRPGLRVPGAWDGFEVAVRAIVGQQVSVKGARTLVARIVARCGRPLAGDVAETGADLGLSHLFPEPGDIAKIAEDGLSMPRARARALAELARATLAGEVAFTGGLDRETFTGKLTALPGIGDWTAQYVAMRALGEPDALPAQDLVLLRAAAFGGESMTARRLAARAEAWRPWRSYAVLHLWQSMADDRGA
jgi:AraC family transcriptional regulator of adaptative response / DNA-3-methyladenine glycosylase II